MIRKKYSLGCGGVLWMSEVMKKGRSREN